MVLPVLLSFSSISSAQNISGPLSGTLGPGTYIVVGDCQVNSGDTLLILPGTEFQHIGNYDWTINGLLLAAGSLDSLVRFVRQLPDSSHNWGGLRFPSATANGSVLDYCVIDHCSNPNRFGGGIYCSNSTITVTNSVISNCVASNGGGIYATYSGIVVEDCEIFGNSALDTPAADDGSGGGIFLDHSGSAEIRRSLIYQNYCSGA
jgi:hypothetical protein